MKITILGAGHGGQALAADLSLKGCNVTLYAHPNHPGGIQAISKAKGIQCRGLMNQFSPIACTTMDLKKAVEDSEYIFVVVPSYVHKDMFSEVMPYLKRNQTIITLAANFASLTYLKLWGNQKNAPDMIDVASLPYVCRADNKGVVEILAIKDTLAIASIPAAAISQHINKLKEIFPCKIKIYRDVLSLGINITSGMTHPAITLLNAGRIGLDKDTFYFYKDGITPEIANLIERLDAERIAIGNKLGLEMYPYLNLMAEYYGTHYKSVYQFFRESPPHNALPLCPKSLKERYITQDVANLLVPWFSIAQLVQHEAPVMSSLIEIASLLNNANYMRDGLNLEALNLHEKNITEIKQYIGDIN